MDDTAPLVWSVPSPSGCEVTLGKTKGSSPQHLVVESGCWEEPCVESHVWRVIWLPVLGASGMPCSATGVTPAGPRRSSVR